MAVGADCAAMVSVRWAWAAAPGIANSAQASRKRRIGPSWRGSRG